MVAWAGSCLFSIDRANELATENRPRQKRGANSNQDSLRMCARVGGDLARNESEEKDPVSTPGNGCLVIPASPTTQKETLPQ